MKSLLAAPLAEPIAHFRAFTERLTRFFRFESVGIGVVTTQRPDGLWDWKNATVWPEDQTADFPPDVGAHFRVLIPGPQFPHVPNDFTTESALVIGEQLEHSQRVFLLRLQTAIEPSSYRSEVITA